MNLEHKNESGCTLSIDRMTSTEAEVNDDRGMRSSWFFTCHEVRYL